MTFANQKRHTFRGRNVIIIMFLQSLSDCQSLSWRNPLKTPYGQSHRRRLMTYRVHEGLFHFVGEYFNPLAPVTLF